MAKESALNSVGKDDVEPCLRVDGNASEQSEWNVYMQVVSHSETSVHHCYIITCKLSTRFMSHHKSYCTGGCVAPEVH